MAGRLCTTRWSLVSQARSHSDTKRLRGLSALLELYLPALHAHATLGMRLSADTAEDLVQQFVLDKILQRDILAKADRDRGRFRTFLVTSFHNFALVQLRKQAARRRSPGQPLLSLDDLGSVAGAPPEMFREYDRAWSRQVLAAALQRMRRDCLDKGRPDVWELFEKRAVEPIFRDRPPPPYEELVAELGLQSPSQAANLFATARASFKRALRDTLRDTLDEAADPDAEIRDLLRSLNDD